MKQKLLQMYFFYFAFFAKYFLKRHRPYIIWVTGSIWKTSARMIISEMLAQHFPEKKIYTSSKNFNGELGMSLSILGIASYTPSILGVGKILWLALFVWLFGWKKYDILFLEYGIDHKGEMDFLLSIGKPDIGIITKIDKVHSQQFANTDIIADEKYLLVKHAQEYAFLNDDDTYAKIFEKDIKVPYFFYTTAQESEGGVDISAKNYELQYRDGKLTSQFDYFFQNQSITSVTSNLIGKENTGYIGIGLHIIYILQQKFFTTSFYGEVSSHLEYEFSLQPSRFGIFAGIFDSVLVDSTYNGAPESMKKVIQNFLILQKEVFPDYEVMLCLWEMRELWEYTKQEHEKLAAFVQPLTSHICVVGKSMEQYFVPKVPQAQYFQNSYLLWEYLHEFLWSSEKKYMILFKGSQNTIFLEESLKPILQDLNDVKKLCRQDGFWMEKKKEFFAEIKQK